ALAVARDHGAPRGQGRARVAQHALGLELLEPRAPLRHGGLDLLRRPLRPVPAAAFVHHEIITHRILRLPSENSWVLCLHDGRPGPIRTCPTQLFARTDALAGGARDLRVASSLPDGRMFGDISV